MRSILYLLAQLSDDDVEWIATAGERKLLPIGTRLVRRKGDPPHALTLILNGAVSVAVEGRGQIARFVAGDMFGEMRLADETSPSTQVTVVEPTIVLSLDRAVLDERMETNEGFAMRLEAGIAMLRSVRLAASAKHESRGNRLPSQARLDTAFMENVHLAGARFDRILKKVTVA